MDYYLQLFINGLVAGSIYALVALGFGLTYGVMRLVNFAFGATCVVGGYAGYVCIVTFGLPPWLAFMAAAAAGAVVGVVIERIAFRPLRDQHPLLPVASSLACAIILENFIAATFGHDVRSYRSVMAATDQYTFFGATITGVQITILMVCVLVLVLMSLYIKKTPLGRETIAVSDDADAAATWGIDRDKIIVANFALGSALAGAGGFLIGLDLDIEPYMGTEIVFRAFTANLIFGLGSLPGAVAGGLSLGELENIVAGLLSSRYKSAYTFIILVIILIVRPRGILDVRTRRFEV